MNMIDVFGASVVLYSIFRYFDVKSTKLCLAKLDPTLHEVNPIAAPLFRKMSFDKAMVLMWIPTALAIGLADTFIVAPIVGIPILWLFFGLFHVFATANNLQVYSRVKQFGAETIEEDTKQLMRKLKSLSKFKRITYLSQMNGLNLFFSLYGIVTLLLFWRLFPLVNVTFRAPIPVLFLLAPIIMIVDFIAFFPTMTFGSLLISLRRIPPDAKLDDLSQNSRDLTVSVEFLEYLVDEAHQKGANCVQIPYDKLTQEEGK